MPEFLSRARMAHARFLCLRAETVIPRPAKGGFNSASCCPPQKPVPIEICMTRGADSGFFLRLSQRTLFGVLALCEADLPCCRFDAFGSVTSAPALTVLWELLRDGLQFLNVVARSRTAVAAEVLFLRKQLAYYRDHQIRPRRLTDAARLSLVLWSRLFDWKEALIVVTPGTFVRWHRKGFKLYWRWKSRGGRPALPKDIRQLIARMIRENIAWGEEGIADELSLKLGILVSPRTVRKYWPLQPDDSRARRASSQHWKTFIKSHAQGIVACDFLVAVTAGSRCCTSFSSWKSAAAVFSTTT